MIDCNWWISWLHYDNTKVINIRLFIVKYCYSDCCLAVILLMTPETCRLDGTKSSNQRPIKSVLIAKVPIFGSPINGIFIRYLVEDSLGAFKQAGFKNVRAAAQIQLCIIQEISVIGRF